MRQNVAPTVAGPAPRTPAADDDSSLAADLELVAKKLADVTRKATRDRDMEAVFATASAEHERRARETAEKTAAALDSVAHWVEQTEGRLNDTARLASQGQERTAGMLNDALGLMTRRLDEIERKITDAQQPSVDAALTAVERIEAQMAKLGQDGRGQAHNAQIEAALRGVEERIAQVSERISHGPARAARGKFDPRVELTSAIEEIRSRQSELEAASSGSARSLRDPGMRSQNELLRSLRDDFARFSGQIDARGPGGDSVEASAVKLEIENLRGSVAELATRQEVGAIERAIHELGRQIGDARAADRDLASIAQPLAAMQAEVQRLAETITADVKSRAALDVEAVSRKLDGISEKGVSADVVERLSRELGEIRGLLKDIADPQRVRSLAEQVAGLNHQIAQVRRQFGNSDFEALASALDDIRTAVKSRPSIDPQPNETFAREIERLSSRIEGALSTAGSAAGIEGQLERLSGRIEGALAAANGTGVVESQLERLSGRIEGALAAAGSPAGVDLLIERLDSLNENLGRSRRDGELKPIEDMLRGLAEKLDEAERPGGNLDGLEKQVSLLSERVEHSSNQPVLAALERSMGELLVQMERIRNETAEAAERAVRSAVIHTMQSLPRSAGGPEAGSLQGELADLKASHEQAGKWTEATLSAVHVTLDKVVSRLATLDHDVSPVRSELKSTHTRGSRAEKPSNSSSRREPEPVEAPSVPEQGFRSAETIPSSKRVEDSLKRLEAELVPHKNASPAESESGRELATVLTADDILLEPGAARPNRGSTPGGPVAANATIEVNDIKASFIAAARRAAQAAASEAAGKDKPGAHQSTSARRGHVGRKGGNLAVRAKQTLDERRRPILLGLAAVVLALGALHLGGNFYGQTIKPTTVAAPRIETKVASATPPTTQREIAPDTTSAIEALDQRITDRSPASSPSQPLAEVATRERDAALGDAKSPTRLDGGRAGSKGEENLAPSPQTLERIPNMASIGTILANAGPASLRQAALAGDPAAVFELASRAAEGRGMNRDLALAARLFEKAAGHGLVPAQYRTGNLYEKGLGVARDLVTAKTWYQRAADKGNARAMHNLAVLIAEGVGGKPDYATAIAWFRRAAQHGIRDSQFNLAVLLARGLGTPQDLSGSYTWFAIVATQGDEDAAKKRDEVAARLGPAELSSAKLAVERWRPESPDKFANEVPQPAQGWTEAPQPKRTANNGPV